ncbi:hypothetical protein GQ53DRAFT_808411 [Thozetella sp. PMI_491]|nr:hypothetical protein GQ53DRAFT_808411 [Thozetella sp. PMI_491]
MTDLSTAVGLADSGSVGSLMEVSTLSEELRGEPSGEPSNFGDIDDPEYAIVDPQIFNSFPTPSHFAALMDALQGKAKELDLFKATDCMSNTHLRWLAANPDNLDCEMTTQDRAVRDRLASTITKGSNPPMNRKGLNWAKTSYIGIMLTGDPKTEPKYYVEIQLKCISGADKYELKNSGVDPNIVFAGLTKQFYSPPPQAEDGQDKGALLKNIDPRLFDPRTWAFEKSPVTIPGIRIRRDSEVSIGNPDDVITVVPPTETGNELAWSMVRVDDAVEVSSHRELVSRFLGPAPKLVSIPTDKEFVERCDKSCVYAVRVIAVEVADACNEFSGPPLSQRAASLWCSGGWLAPPLEERAAQCNALPTKYDPFRNGKYKPLPLKCHHVAQEVIMDGSFAGPVLNEGGHPAPVWCEPTEPCLEDVYSLVWDMMSGKRYAGFRPGIGFGLTRAQTLKTDLASASPFTSPSSEALYLAANGHL